MLLLGTRQLLQQLTTVPSFDSLGEQLLPLQSTKDLGLVVDFHLTFNEHTCIQQLLASCTAKLCQIDRVKHVFLPLMSINVYTSYHLPARPSCAR